MTHTRKHGRRSHRGGNEVPEYIVRASEARIAENRAKAKAFREEVAKKKAEKKQKFEHAMAHPRRSARLAAKRRHGGRRTRRK